LNSFQDCEASFAARSPEISDLSEQYVLSRWVGFDAAFCREARGRLMTAELRSKCEELAKARVISWAAALFFTVHVTEILHSLKQIGILAL
jgi:hypothetical protein